ncbi:hypothetical protein, unlikely [Trypanosoma brucei gambiense DAL972]|uniref:Uncharacterized protein n=1 Tax=Trypanosoma brucei gambiense (strain MHOM/CI/86/DAL972) TaxID=679716 RepID=C9ZPE8_TRYB9|nr:hypothetical protein, unlikely [Trypanosoma brucei gambiense DAL972]CBH11276.1 hypothetical protein, unlikely [Trypanosoma brucei gambiense DAL972]|eukprot:XP_011773563.1 hypothetical protein, unlikely [Trypanosoma brucei gambiense DAL972]
MYSFCLPCCISFICIIPFLPNFVIIITLYDTILFCVHMLVLVQRTQIRSRCSGWHQRNNSEVVGRNILDKTLVRKNKNAVRRLGLKHLGTIKKKGKGQHGNKDAK